MKVFLFALGLYWGFYASAGECELTIHRTACPGKEKAAYEPYKEVNPTIEKKSATTEKDCADRATKACKIVRKDILSKKDVMAKFDGKVVAGGKNVCEGINDAKSDCK